MTTYTVTNDASLAAALAVAGAGDSVLMAAGRYADVRVYGATGLTFASLDPARPAVLTGLTVRDSANLSFSNLEFDVTGQATTAYAVTLERSANVTFDRLLVHGSMNGNPSDDAAGMLVRTSRDVSITNSRFTELSSGVNHLDMQGLVVEGNAFHDIRMDGVRGGGSSQVRVVGNFFTDFFPSKTDHPDAIQFWTSNTTASASDILIANNLIVRGRGEPIQGIFVTDQVGSLPYLNLRIEGNFVSGGLYNGLTVSGAVDALVQSNVVAGWPDLPSWIQMSSATVTTGGNLATGYVRDGTAAPALAGDTQIDSAWDGGVALMADWAANLPTGVSYSDAFQAELAAPTFPTQTVVGTPGADTLIGLGSDVYLKGGDGNDLLMGNLGMVVMAGGRGDDRYIVRDSDDTVFEARNEGIDQVTAHVDYQMPENVEHLILAGAARYGLGNGLANRINGGASNDSLLGAGGADTLGGGAGADTLDGGTGNDSLRGGDGNDLQWGGDDNDFLAGEAGNDFLSGGNGNDTLDGGAGADRMWGGAGADVFIFRTADIAGVVDRIEDFRAAQGDKIGLNMIDASTLLAGDQAFTFIATAAFSRKAGELRYEAGSGASRLLGDTNGDGVADFEILVVGATSLVASDFWL